ncbi:MAG: pyridoxamine 5'-phosphate oxidase family protein [Planctomycetes bacterium]|nr:pyridoxamine 5'-phosphate oxidase family protein [Planctomycetota bacterium]
MAREYLRRVLTPTVRAAERHYYGRSYPDQGPEAGNVESAVEPLGTDELAFVAARDSFYLATVTENGWPYVQHRGGPRGFLRALSPAVLAFADYGGNRQLVSAGSLAAEPRVSLFLMDYPGRTRLKILGRAEVLDARDHVELVEATAPAGGHAAAPERFVRIEVVASDWNCPKFITERYSRDEIETYVEPLRARIRELEQRLGEGGAAGRH